MDSTGFEGHAFLDLVITNVVFSQHIKKVGHRRRCTTLYVMHHSESLQVQQPDAISQISIVDTETVFFNISTAWFKFVQMIRQGGEEGLISCP